MTRSDLEARGGCMLTVRSSRLHERKGGVMHVSSEGRILEEICWLLAPLVKKTSSIVCSSAVRLITTNEMLLGSMQVVLWVYMIAAAPLSWLSHCLDRIRSMVEWRSLLKRLANQFGAKVCICSAAFMDTTSTGHRQHPKGEAPLGY